MRRRDLPVREGAEGAAGRRSTSDRTVPWTLIVAHVAFLAGIVYFAHHPIVFVGLFLFFLGVAEAYRHYHDRLCCARGCSSASSSRLVTLGALQQWCCRTCSRGWIRPRFISVRTALTATPTMRR